ncbi:hypothetical protein F6Y02_35770 [Bacillus megaterium]|nr:hypothetical protein [Priestia megaterium]
MQGLVSQVQAFSSLDDAFKGKGGEAIRSFTKRDMLLFNAVSFITHFL